MVTCYLVYSNALLELGKFEFLSGYSFMAENAYLQGLRHSSHYL